MNGSNWTGKTSRTVQDAFGPYTSRYVDPPESELSRAKRISDWLFATALGCIAAIVLFAWWSS